MRNDNLVANEKGLFFRRWLTAPKQLGTLAPISQRLARAAAQLVQDPACAKVVELGAGTGRLTRSLLNAGIKAENLTAVELDDTFCRFLKSTLPKVNVIQGDVCELPALLGDNVVGTVDVVFSVIPLMYLTLPLREQIVTQALAVLKPEGKLYHVCYTPVSPLKKHEIIESKRLISMWVNLPPGFVWEFSRATSKA